MGRGFLFRLIYESGVLRNISMPRNIDDEAEQKNIIAGSLTVNSVNKERYDVLSKL